MKEVQEIKELILSAFLSADKAIEEATRSGEAAHMAGDTQAQHLLERTVYALMEAKNKAIEAMLALEEIK